MQSIQESVAGRRQGLAAARISFTPEEAAESTGLSRTRIFKALQEGKLTAKKDGKATIIEADELARYIRELPTRKAA